MVLLVFEGAYAQEFAFAGVGVKIITREALWVSKMPIIAKIYSMHGSHNADDALLARWQGTK